MLSLHQLRCFLAAYETGSLTAAAEQLGYAQPSVSEQIKSLERSVGTDLRLLLRAGGPDNAGGVPADERIARLTGREREVLAMLGEGLSNQEIAARMGIGIGTVKTHVGAILDKTGSTSRVQAALLAHRTGLAT